MHDETDLQLVHLLQIDPRISWARAGEILMLSGPTVAKRWHRLNNDGLAWITTHPNPDLHYSAVVEIDCRTENLPAVIQQLCAHPQVASVDEATGKRDLLAVLICPSMQILTDLVIDWIGGLEGVYGTRSSLITEVISGGDSWRINALRQRQVQQATAHTTTEHPPPQWGDLEKGLVAALTRDGRVSVADLSRDLEVPISTIHRRLRALLASRQIISRCDVSPALAGWQLECTWFATVPMNHKAQVVKTLKGHPVLRWSMWTTGHSNLIINARMKNLAALAAIESAIAASIPGLAVESTVHLRTHKVMGWILDGNGNATGELIPPDFSFAE